MPLYEYRCPKCRTTFELLRPMSASDGSATCPKGHDGAQRVVSLVASRVYGENGGSMTGSTGGGGCACGGRACGCGH
jgi:putative FmdB family regulatory protein